MRIIGGSARGRPIDAPKGIGTRPTQDHVREAAFNLLQGQVAGAAVLDLFAGSGALGLEALSRGADRTTFVERDRAAAAVLTRNAHSLGFHGACLVLAMDWRKALPYLARQGQRFDLILMDPPYDLDGQEILRGLEASGLPGEGAWILLEQAKGKDLSMSSGAYALQRRRIYGDTELWLWRRTTQPESE